MSYSFTKNLQLHNNTSEFGFTSQLCKANVYPFYAVQNRLKNTYADFKTMFSIRKKSTVLPIKSDLMIS